MNWIRIAVGIADDPKMQKVAEALRVRLPEAVGLVVATLCQLPNHARDGDVTEIPDATLEKWSGWHGKSGVFSIVFRSHLCTDGTVSAWEKHNGAAVRKSDADAARQADYRAKRGATLHDNPPPVTRDNTRDITRDIARDGTGRDVTEYNSSFTGDSQKLLAMPAPTHSPRGRSRLTPAATLVSDLVARIEAQRGAA